MAILKRDLRAGLVEAGASDELATKAVTEVATYGARLTGLEARLSVLTWMVGFNLALTLLVFGCVLSIWTRLSIWTYLGEIAGQLVGLHR